MSFNNPNNLPPVERAITPVRFFGKGINFEMSKERRRKKQARHRANEPFRIERSREGILTSKTK